MSWERAELNSAKRGRRRRAEHGGPVAVLERQPDAVAPRPQLASRRDISRSGWLRAASSDGGT